MLSEEVADRIVEVLREGGGAMSREELMNEVVSRVEGVITYQVVSGIKSLVRDGRVRYSMDGEVILVELEESDFVGL